MNIEKEVNKAIIINWINKHFEKGSVKFEMIDLENFRIIDKKGDVLELNINELEF